jgi:hypothetical protein
MDPSTKDAAIIFSLDTRRLRIIHERHILFHEFSFPFAEAMRLPPQMPVGSIEFVDFGLGPIPLIPYESTGDKNTLGEKLNLSVFDLNDMDTYSSALDLDGLLPPNTTPPPLERVRQRIDNHEEIQGGGDQEELLGAEDQSTGERSTPEGSSGDHKEQLGAEEQSTAGRSLPVRSTGGSTYLAMSGFDRETLDFNPLRIKIPETKMR